jgi:serine protease Do
MKLTRNLFGRLLCAGLVIFAAAHFVSSARENAPVVRVETTPVNRDARLGVSFSPVVKKAAPSVVNIYTTRFIKERPAWNPFQNDPVFRQLFGGQIADGARERTRKVQVLGSGVIVSPDGYILTANHVVADADEIKISFGENKKEFPARLVGRDDLTDVAVLKIDASGLPAVTLADSDLLEVGDVVLAIGNPFGVGQTVTMGIVSALGRSGPGFIQTDAAINPGNSGGALVDAEGRLVGINTAIISSSRGSEGVGLAVPSNIARHVLERLISDGKITRGYAGNTLLQDLDAGLAKQFNLTGQDGALVGDVEAGSPAATAGLKSGDVITGINGHGISGADNFNVTISQLQPGASAALTIIRNGAATNLSVKLIELPPTADSVREQKISQPDKSMSDALDGVTVADIEPEIRRQLRVPLTIQGALVSELNRNSNAAEARLMRGDIIIEVNHQPVSDAADAKRLGRAAKGDQILVKVWRRNGDFAGTLFLNVDNTKRPK